MTKVGVECMYMLMLAHAHAGWRMRNVACRRRLSVSCDGELGTLRLSHSCTNYSMLCYAMPVIYYTS